MAGRFLVFDGPDGSGKSTQFRRFSALLQDSGVVTCEVREPGGTVIGERIREMLLDPSHQEMDLRCEMLLYMASRAQLMAQRIRPALAAGQCVLADRFISSTLAYQGTAGGLDRREILDVGRIAIADQWPDLVVVFDVDEKTAAARLSPLLDRIEQRGAAYHQRVRQGYLDQVRRQPQRHRVIDSRGEPDEVFALLLTNLRDWVRNSPAG
ncbi:MAG: dTMP kinase [Phycisphaeraceae bacterium]|nr:dTMP kinase [Phycisphaeraceae bacterium]